MSASSSRAGTATTAAARVMSCASSSRRRARLVGLVVAEGEHADLLAAAQVAHDEVRVALGLHARLVEAVAPCGVLERVVADGGPEARRGRPRGVLAGERAPGDLAVGQRVAPVLDAQAPAGARVLRGGDVADGEHGRVRAAHRGVHEHGAVLDVEAGGGRQLACAGRRRCRAPPCRRTASRRRRPAARASAARCARARRPGATSTPASHSSVVMSSPARSPRRSACGRSSGATRTTSTPRRTSEAAASQAMKPAPTTTARVPGCATPRRRRASSTVRTVCRSGSSRPVHGRALRAPSRWRARRRRRAAPGRPRGARSAPGGRARPRGARGAASRRASANQASSSSGSSAGSSSPRSSSLVRGGRL